MKNVYGCFASGVEPTGDEAVAEFEGLFAFCGIAFSEPMISRTDTAPTSCSVWRSCSIRRTEIVGS